MARPIKNSIKVSYNLDKQIAEELESFCEATGRTKTKAVEMAIREFLERYKEQSFTD